MRQVVAGVLAEVGDPQGRYVDVAPTFAQDYRSRAGYLSFNGVTG